jgi:hypothetical protein
MKAASIAARSSVGIESSDAATRLAGRLPGGATGAGSAGGSTFAGVSLGGSADRADRELDGRRDVVPAAALRVDRFFDVAIARPPFAGVDSPQAVDLHVRRRT